LALGAAQLRGTALQLRPPHRHDLGTPVACPSFMEALSSLVREHRFIERLVAALDAYAALVGQGAQVDPADVRGFARTLREYADELHRQKEEHVLLPFLVRQGFDWEAPPLSQVCEEHSFERDLIAALDHAGARIERWTDEERRHVAALAASICTLQRQHHQTENEQLFPAVMARLDRAALQLLQGELERFDGRPAHVERRTAARDRGEDLIARYAALDRAAQ
jgi:hemerythrin-like domain-containing protein